MSILPYWTGVCACFNVGINTIVDTIKSKKITSPEEVGNILRAGTNCGSCVPEIRELIDQSLLRS